jgi:hypothetical protein
MVEFIGDPVSCITLKGEIIVVNIRSSLEHKGDDIKHSSYHEMERKP